MGGDKQKLDKDGYPSEGAFYPADPHRLQTYTDASQHLSGFQAPVLIHADNAHERLYLACFDGTGNDRTKDPVHSTNVAKIDLQVRELNKTGDTRVISGYVPGPGTQDSFVPRTLDGITGLTYDQRTEQMYKLFIEQAKKWRQEDPKAEIRIAEIGFSRGADQVPGFARLVQERGVQDPSGAQYTRDAHGQITHVEYTRPPLVAPGQTAQAVGLFDPVGTGDPIKYHDRRLPPSVISGFQITADDERRGLFKSDRIIKPGESPDGRFLAVNVAGAHSDVGGSYLRDGLAIRSDNLMTDYLNGLSDKPYLKKQSEPTDPSLNVVHRSEQSMLLYKFYPKIDRTGPGGYNDLLVPRNQIAHVGDAYHAQPRDESLSNRFERQPVKIAPLPAPQQAKAASADDLSSRLDNMLAAGQSGDRAAFRAGTQALANSDAARAMHTQAADMVNRQTQQQAPPPASQLTPQQPSAGASPPQR
ncbi:phospholipase effector Tle1 domain-containing protein [Rhodanobacter sp. BL-MT-08]